MLHMLQIFVDIGFSFFFIILITRSIISEKNHPHIADNLRRGLNLAVRNVQVTKSSEHISVGDISSTTAGAFGGNSQSAIGTDVSDRNMLDEDVLKTEMHTDYSVLMLPGDLQELVRQIQQSQLTLKSTLKNVK
jgi:hypothetical protein